MKSVKNAKSTTRSTANTVKKEDNQQKTAKKKTSLAIDKNADKKTSTRKSVIGAATTSRKSDVIKLSNVAKVSDVKKASDRPLSKRNVMNSIHNVTVASPPSSASRERSASLIEETKTPKTSLNRQRSKTRTIRPEDSILMKFDKPTNQKIVQPSSIDVAVVKEPVAFEINFEEAKKTKTVTKEPEEQVDEDENYDYESDFESYESDFEDEVPTTSEDDQELDNENDNEDADDDDEIMQSKEKTDSGNETTKKTSASSNFESIEDTINSHDSGFSYDRVTSPKNREIYRRGREIMKKVIFDEMNFEIFEMKPLQYEIFMALFGDYGMSQVSTQVDNLQVSDEVQTDEISKAEKWIQFPARFTKTGLEHAKSRLYNEEKLGVGEGKIEKIKNEMEDSDKVVDDINNFSKFEDDKFHIIEHFDSRGYQNFLDTSELFISRALEKEDNYQNLQSAQFSLSEGFYKLQYEKCQILQNTIVEKIYGNLKMNSFFITVHKTNENRGNLMCLWDLINSNRPLKVFQSYSKISCMEIHENQRNIVIGGCDDGAISIWDAAEFIEWRDDEMLIETIKPCEIVSPITEGIHADKIVALNSLIYPKYKSLGSQPKITQFCSLSQNGLVIIWSLSKIDDDEHLILSGKFKNSDLDFLHVKSRNRLMKNITIDLNAQSKEMTEKSARKKSAFEKTRYYFENDLFNDKVLKELQEINTNQVGKPQDDLSSFVDCESSFNEIFAATNSNFLIGLSRLNFEDTRKIFTSDFASNSITVVKTHPKYKNIVAVGNSNGEVKFLKIYQESSENEKLKVIFEKNIFNSFELASGAVKSIEFDRNGELMFIIIGKMLKIFNCWKNSEVECHEISNIKSLKCITGADCCEYLIFLTNNNEVLINKLKN